MRLTLLLLLLCGAAMACGREDERGAPLPLENNAFIKLPGGRAKLEGSSVVVTTRIDATTDAGEGFEPLQAGYGYHAWARAGATYTSLGAFTPGVDLETSAAGEGDEIIVSVESSALGDSPSSTIAVRGAVGSTLSFGSLSALSYTGARADAYMGADWIELEYQGMPSLPSGYRYQLWLVGKDAANAPTGEAMSAGELDAPPDGKTERFESAMFPVMFDVAVSIEADAGTQAMARPVCLKVEHDHSRHSH